MIYLNAVKFESNAFILNYGIFGYAAFHKHAGTRKIKRHGISRFKKTAAEENKYEREQEQKQKERPFIIS